MPGQFHVADTRGEWGSRLCRMDPQLRFHRKPERRVTERAQLDAILDEALVAHLGVVRE